MGMASAREAGIREERAMATAGAAGAAAAALAAAQGYQLLVGGLLLELPPEGFLDVHRKLGGLVFTGCTKTFWSKRPKTRYYFLPYQGVTLYCRLGGEEVLHISGAVEVNKITLGPLADYIGK
jgi:hypothetical protein